MPKGSKARLLIQIGVSLGIALVILTLVIFLGLDIGKRANDVAVSRGELNGKIKQLNNLAELQSDKETSEIYSIKLQEVLPKRDDLLSFPSRIDAIAGSHNVASQFSFGNESDKNIQFSLVIQGNYNNIVSFIETIEKDILFLDLESFDVVGSDIEYSAKLVGTIYFNE